MTLVERFIEISNWPASRKVVLLTALVMPSALLAWAAVHYSLNAIPIADAALMDSLLAAWTSSLALIFLASLSFALAGKEARWTAYLFALSFMMFLAVLLYLWGTTSTGLIAFYPAVVLFWGQYFDERLAWAGMLTGLILIISVSTLESWGVLPYAPILLERSIDAQRNDLWSVVILFSILQVFFISFVISILVVRARHLQESRLKHAQKLIRRYVPSQVADSILSGQQAVVEKHERRKLTIFFSDLVGFTDISEEMEPEDLSRILNEYFSEMTRIASQHGGTVDELAGDAVLIFFGAPNATDDKDHALRAARMAMEMQQAVQSLNEKWKAAGIDVVLKARMGLNTGVVTIGNFGSPERMKYSALGKHVNIAARLQAHCEPGRVLISHPTWLLIQDQIPCQPRGELTLKGIAKPVMAYEITALPAGAS